MCSIWIPSPLHCSCWSPLCSFQHKDLLLAEVGTMLMTKPCHCSSALAPWHPQPNTQITLLPPSSLTTLQRSFQHSCFQLSSPHQITHIWGYFLLEALEAFTRVHQQSGCVSVFPDSFIPCSSVTNYCEISAILAAPEHMINTVFTERWQRKRMRNPALSFKVKINQ